MKNYIPFYILIISFFSLHMYSQKNKIAVADQQYTNYAYIDAIKTYERVASKGYKSANMFKKLGDSFYFNAEFDKAAKWYDELFAMTNDVEPEYYYRYAQSLKSTNHAEKANQMLDLFYQKSKDDTRGKLYKKNENYLDLIKANSGRYTIEDAGINSKYSDYGTAFFQNKIVFTSARDTGGLGQQKHKWTGESFTNLYEAVLDEDFNPSTPKKIKSKINSKFHESSPTFTKDGTTVYFTRNNYIDGKKGKNEQKITFIKIYKATLNQKKEWDNIIELPFNSNDYSTAHPVLSPDEKTLYFASDMPGTIGQSDIYKVEVLGTGGYSSPQNLGPGINTEGKETFPFVTDENEIYFASDGHPGLGGLDVFVGKINNAGVSNIQNLGADINSPNDDFAYIIDIQSRRGFFSSNRKGGQGSDDIYKFLEIQKINTAYQLYGIVTDLETTEVLPNAKITLYDQALNIKNSTYSDEKGNYSFFVDPNTPYNIRVEKEDYTTWEQIILVSKDRPKAYLPIPLEKSRYQVTIGDDLGKCFGIKMIYFDLDKFNIGKEAALDLEKILDVLKQYPNMKLDIRSHTDSRQTHKYNQLLSDKRAKSTIDWLIKNGIDKDKLTGKGYGETQLLNHCGDTENCTEEEHQMNRRSEFIISGL